MKILLILLVTTIFLISENVNSQLSQQWANRYNASGNGNDEANKTAIDNAGNVYVTGRSFLSGSNFDYATIKYNANGDELWVSRYNGSGGIDEANAIAVDNAGNVYVTGKSQGGASNSDFVTIKYNPDGVQLWLRSYNGSGNGIDEAVGISVDANENVYITGISWSGFNNDIATVKYNSLGVVQFAVRYNGLANGDDYPTSIHAGDNEIFYLTGVSAGNGSGNDFVTIMYLPNGSANWVRRYNGPDNSDDYGRSITVDNTGNIFVTGESISALIGYDYATIKYNQIGDSLWVNRFNGSANGDDISVSVKTDSLNNVYVTGSSIGTGTSEDYVTLKYNSSGIQQWLQRYNGIANGRDVPSAIVIGKDNSIYLTGSSLGSGTGSDFATVKYNDAGVEQWSRTYNGNGNGIDGATSIAVNRQDYVVVTGLSYGGSGTNYDYVTVKYSQVSGIQNLSNEIPAEYMLYQNYPNPFNPVTNIKFDVVKSGNVKITVSDISGKLVSELLNSKMNPGTYLVDFNASQFASGIYFYTLSAQGNVITKKMTVLK
ncbi:MAG: SBBP repeat-containing protein [Ignavibacteria bacterium]|nr:SBBP repeat-containing protein [Ignavibacteria bacterium]